MLFTSARTFLMLKLFMYAGGLAKIPVQDIKKEANVEKCSR